MLCSLIERVRSWPEQISDQGRYYSDETSGDWAATDDGVKRPGTIANNKRHSFRLPRAWSAHLSFTSPRDDPRIAPTQADHVMNGTGTVFHEVLEGSKAALTVPGDSHLTSTLWHRWKIPCWRTATGSTEHPSLDLEHLSRRSTVAVEATLVDVVDGRYFDDPDPTAKGLYLNLVFDADDHRVRDASSHPPRCDGGL